MEKLCEGVWVESLHSTDSGFRAFCVVDPGHPGFEGHFKARPVLPACCQFELLEALVRRAEAPSLTFAGVPRSKFLGIIEPGMRLEVSLSRGRAHAHMHAHPHSELHSEQEFDFSLSSEGKVFTRGKIVFVPRAARAEGACAPAYI